MPKEGIKHATKLNVHPSPSLFTENNTIPLTADFPQNEGMNSKLSRVDDWRGVASNGVHDEGQVEAPVHSLQGEQEE